MFTASTRLECLWRVLFQVSRPRPIAPDHIIRVHYEGGWKENARFTLFKFPSMQALQSFWNSDEYQAIKHLRTDAIAPNFTFAVEQFDPAEWAAKNPDHAYLDTSA